MTSPRYVTFATVRPRLKVTALRGQTQPIPEGGYGGWQIVPRQRRRSLTSWVGVDPVQIAVNVVLGVTPNGDAFRRNVTAQPDMDALERMAWPPGEGEEPPIVNVSGAVPHAGSFDWVIASFDWDSSSALYSPKGFLVRQPVTVHLMQHVAPTLVQSKPAAQQAREKAAKASTAAAKTAGVSPAKVSPQKFYVVRAGDSLSSIAAKLLGSAKRWTEIASANGLRDPNFLTVGQKLRLP